MLEWGGCCDLEKMLLEKVENITSTSYNSADHDVDTN